MKMRSSLLFLTSALLLAQRPIPVNNEWARVVIATTSPAPKGRMHKHDMNRVMIYLDKGTQRIAQENGAVTDIRANAGDVKWDPKGGLHTSENVGGTTFRIVEIELRKDGSAVPWPAAVPAGAHIKELENNQVRVLRLKIGPRQKLPEHEHAFPQIIVPLSEVDFAVTSADGTRTSLKGKSGDAIFAQPGRHAEENLLDQPVEILLVELKD